VHIEFHGCLGGNRGSYVNVDGQDYLVKKATFEKFNHYINGKCLVEAIEQFAYEEIVKKGLTNNEYFERVTK